MYYLLNEELASWEELLLHNLMFQWPLWMPTEESAERIVWIQLRHPCSKCGEILDWIMDWETWFNPHWDQFSRASSMSLKVCFYPRLWVIAREAQWVPEGKLACLRMLANHLHLVVPEPPALSVFCRGSFGSSSSCIDTIGQICAQASKSHPNCLWGLLTIYSKSWIDGWLTELSFSFCQGF